MHDDKLPVPSTVDIHFKNINAKLNGVLEGVKCVLGPKTTTASVGYHKNTVTAKEGMVGDRSGQNDQNAVNNPPRRADSTRPSIQEKGRVGAARAAVRRAERR